ncbi:MAG: SRPBCC domain-containing protein [Bacteroidetes bacterium]|nr:SRPBCC domain-containing protein [Bacteroidota bacterium]
MNRVKLEMEFMIKSSPNILFNYISTPSGLLEWFADDVNVKGKRYTFIWEGDEMNAELIKKVNGKYVRFQWEDSIEEEFFEMEIRKDELTGDIALVVTDYADEDEAEETSLLWESQVQDLRNALGA